MGLPARATTVPSVRLHVGRLGPDACCDLRSLPIFSAVIACRTGNPAGALHVAACKVHLPFAIQMARLLMFAQSPTAIFRLTVHALEHGLRHLPGNTALRSRLNNDLVRQGDSNGMRLSD